MNLSQTDRKIMELYAPKELKVDCLIETTKQLVNSVKKVQCVYLHYVETWGVNYNHDEYEILGTPPRLDEIVEKFGEFFNEKRGLVTLIRVLECRMISPRRAGKKTAGNALWILEHWENGKTALEQEEATKLKLIELIRADSEEDAVIPNP